MPNGSLTKHASIFKEGSIFRSALCSKNIWWRAQSQWLFLGKEKEKK
jgi:hypothetical protein